MIFVDCASRVRRGTGSGDFLLTGSAVCILRYDSKHFPFLSLFCSEPNFGFLDDPSRLFIDTSIDLCQNNRQPTECRCDKFIRRDARQAGEHAQEEKEWWRRLRSAGSSFKNVSATKRSVRELDKVQDYSRLVLQPSVRAYVRACMHACTHVPSRN